MANISKIKLPNESNPYDIADKTVRSNVENNTYKFLTYKDNTNTEAQIKALTSAKVGDFYIASDTGTAWVCVTAINGTASASSWEKTGSSADVSAFVTAVDAGPITDTVPQTFEGHQISEFVLKTDVSAFVTAVDESAITDTVPQTFEGHQVGEFVLKTDVVNNLTSTATNVPLSAAQGKALNDKIATAQTAANDALPKSGGTLTGIVAAQSNTAYTTKQIRNVILSTSEPTSSDGANGDIWIKYTN